MNWNVSPELISTGFLHVRWYGLFFSIAFLSGREIVRRFFVREKISLTHLDSLLGYMMVGTVLGARLGHCLFYEPEIYLHDPLRILQFWEGGLASHGAFIGILTMLYVFARKHRELSYLSLLDRMTVPVAFAGILIRLGNLFNSEILGKESHAPWAFVFNRVDQIPRHPAQLYESFAYLASFLILRSLYWKTEARRHAGLLLGYFLILIFGFRFLLEFFKENQVGFEAGLPINMGQILSIPLVTLGVILVVRGRKSELLPEFPLSVKRAK
ncbi:MAG: prolipoprotein diacylglyceryl transferase [Methylotenera sp.]|nr:prolipoprotein diacylglyceryl transferase [Oligoflexia bacterium]